VIPAGKLRSQIEMWIDLSRQHGGRLTKMRLLAGFQCSFRALSEPDLLGPHSTRIIDLSAEYRTVHSLSSHMECSKAIALCAHARRGQTERSVGGVRWGGWRGRVPPCAGSETPRTLRHQTHENETPKKTVGSEDAGEGRPAVALQAQHTERGRHLFAHKLVHVLAHGAERGEHLPVPPMLWLCELPHRPLALRGRPALEVHAQELGHVRRERALLQVGGARHRPKAGGEGEPVAGGSGTRRKAREPA